MREKADKPQPTASRSGHGQPSERSGHAITQTTQMAGSQLMPIGESSAGAMDSKRTDGTGHHHIRHTTGELQLTTKGERSAGAMDSKWSDGTGHHIRHTTGELQLTTKGERSAGAMDSKWSDGTGHHIRHTTGELQLTTKGERSASVRWRCAVPCRTSPCPPRYPPRSLEDHCRQRTAASSLRAPGSLRSGRQRHEKT